MYSRFEKHVEKGGDGAELGFSAAPVGPDNAIARRSIFEKCVDEVIKGRVHFGVHRFAGHVETEDRSDVAVQLVKGLRADVSKQTSSAGQRGSGVAVCAGFA